MAERVLLSGQDVVVELSRGSRLNFCANNYLGLANHPAVIRAATEALETFGFGIAASRFVCGTQIVHTELEARIAEFLKVESAILYNTCFDANCGFFQPLFNADDCIISDELNHASIIDGIRLCKASRQVYRHADLGDLEDRLRRAQRHRRQLIATDGVFSMNGDLAPLPEICELARKYGAMLMVDDCHGTGVLGTTGRGTAEHFGVLDRIDILTSTFGKALGGVSGGFVAGQSVVVDALRRHSRPYLFSNSIPPSIVVGVSKALEIIESNPRLVKKLQDNTTRFKQIMSGNGFNVPEGPHPIVPIIVNDESVAQEMATFLEARGIFAAAFSYPVVPRGQARLRVQISASHSEQHLERAAAEFLKVARELGVPLKR